MDIASRKFDRFRQKVNEKLGGQEVQTTMSDEFKQLEAEMNLRHEGTRFLLEFDHGAMN